ncbi:hypothetical protein FRC19_000240 [Serendipita sp. 401]|nr:hypothetical protein FRC19_000240 [Serendipita sp. 401]KAG9056376.1 hypothetical protein FS842_010892 [Serendipita sp. 407]
MNQANALANPNGQPQPPPLPLLPTNGSVNDNNLSTIAQNEPEKNIVIAWSGPGGTFGGWKLDDDDIPHV